MRRKEVIAMKVQTNLSAGEGATVVPGG